MAQFPRRSLRKRERERDREREREREQEDIRAGEDGCLEVLKRGKCKNRGAFSENVTFISMQARTADCVYVAMIALYHSPFFSLFLCQGSSCIMAVRTQEANDKEAWHSVKKMKTCFGPTVHT